jgi:hypothetical protein
MIGEAIAHWRKTWSYQQRKHELGPDDHDTWTAYVNGLTMAEVLEALELHGDTVQHMSK